MRLKCDAIILLPLWKGLKSSCSNFITPTGGNFISGVNISQLYFHPRAKMVCERVWCKSAFKWGKTMLESPHISCDVSWLLGDFPFSISFKPQSSFDWQYHAHSWLVKSNTTLWRDLIYQMSRTILLLLWPDGSDKATGNWSYLLIVI